MHWNRFAVEETEARGESGSPGSLSSPGWDGVTGLLCPGRCERPQVWTSACVWASTQGTCCVVSLGCASGSTTCGPTTCLWPTGWRRLESLGEAQRDGGGVRGRGPTLGWGLRVGSETGAVTSRWGSQSGLWPARPLPPPPPGGRQPPLGPAALTRVSPSRVHITEATLNHLDKAYEVEDGHGQQRDPHLKEMNIHTYLVIDPRVRGLRRSSRAGGPRSGDPGSRGCAGERVHTLGEDPHGGESAFLFQAVETWGSSLPRVGVSSPSRSTF